LGKLSLHILDIVGNATKAGVTLIVICIFEDIKSDQMKIEIIDNGSGIPKEIVDKVTNPFVTTCATRRDRLGLFTFQQLQNNVMVI